MRGRGVGLVVLALLGSAACGGGGSTSPETTATPSSTSQGTASKARLVLDQDFPDPDVVKVQNTFYAYATQPKDNSANISMATSPDLRTWKVATTDPLPKLPAWATNGRTWAPDVSAVKGGFVMYFTAHSIEPDLQCIGVAKGTRPTGPFTPVGGEPLVCPAKDGGAIDPASFVDTDGTRYLLWKNDGNCCGKDTWLHLQKVSADGLTLTGPAQRLVKQDQAWEGNLVEAPTLVKHGSSYVLVYSANDYGGADYATGYATSRKVNGPYRKAKQPLLDTESVNVTGPGGQDVLVDDTGASTIVFHGWDATVIYRGMYTAPLQWKGNLPVVQ